MSIKERIKNHSVIATSMAKTPINDDPHYCVLTVPHLMAAVENVDRLQPEVRALVDLITVGGAPNGKSIYMNSNMQQVLHDFGKLLGREVSASELRSPGKYWRDVRNAFNNEGKMELLRQWMWMAQRYLDSTRPKEA